MNHIEGIPLAFKEHTSSQGGRATLQVDDSDIFSAVWVSGVHAKAQLSEYRGPNVIWPQN
jgi:hypothetical protein